jgi:hypothetical protein
MPYIDSAYYLDSYFGADPGDVAMLNKAIARASDVIDILTHYALSDTFDEEYMKDGGIDKRRQFVQDQVKKATAAQAEHYILYGGYDAVQQALQQSSANIGGFSFNGDKVPEVPEKVFALLSTTGLLHTEIHSGFDNGLYYIGWWY